MAMKLQQDTQNGEDSATLAKVFFLQQNLQI